MKYVEASYIMCFVVRGHVIEASYIMVVLLTPRVNNIYIEESILLPNTPVETRSVK